jgi:sugar/nucleoside kinase (ribokinase family)
MKKLDFLAVGDIVIDAFIELEDANVTCNVDKENCVLSMKFADKIPYRDVTIVNAVGNSPNAATSAARLGLSAGLATNLGNDQNGKDCLAVLKENNIDTSLVEINSGMKTNYHYVLMYEADRTILIKHEPYEYDLKSPSEAPAWMYLSSVGAGTEKYHEQIADYLEENPEIKLVFQPGTFQMKMGTEKLARLYKRTEVFVCNVEESQRILGVRGRTSTERGPTSITEEVKTLMSKIHQLGPKIVCITDGPKGAYASDGKNAWFMPIYPDPKAPISRTGAGDAFASTFTSALALGKSVEEALTWAPINSMNVVQHVGAQTGLLSREQLQEYLAKAPEDYKVKKI